MSEKTMSATQVLLYCLEHKNTRVLAIGHSKERLTAAIGGAYSELCDRRMMQKTQLTIYQRDPRLISHIVFEKKNRSQVKLYDKMALALSFDLSGFRYNAVWIMADAELVPVQREMVVARCRNDDGSRGQIWNEEVSHALQRP